MNRRIVRAAAAAALVLVAGTACGLQGADFCAANEAAAEVSVGLTTAIANGEEDEYYPELADAYEAMAAVAPPEAVADITLLADYYRADRSGYDEAAEDAATDAATRVSEVLTKMCT